MEGLSQDHDITSEKAFNQLTLETIKLLHMMLKFGFFTFQKSTKNNKENMPLPKRKNSKNSKKNVVLSKITTSFENDLEKLFFILARILSFNEEYEQGIAETKPKQINNPLLPNKVEKTVQKTVRFVRSELNKQVKALKNIFIFEKDEKLKYKKPKKYVIESEISNDQLFMKMQTMRKILMRFENKTYSFNEDKQQTAANDFEKLIKLEICKVFEYLMDIHEDFYLDNVIGYFHEIFIIKFKDKNLQEIDNIMKNEGHFLWILPNAMAEINPSTTINHKFMKIFKGLQASIRGFDEIMGTPFIETILKAFYFAQDPELQNSIMGLIMRNSTKKLTFYGLLKKTEILFSSEQIEIFHALNKLVNKMYLYSIDSQNWLQYNDDNLALDRIETLIEKTKKQLGKIESILKNIRPKEIMEMKRKILKNTGAIQLIIDLMETLLPFFENEEIKERENRGDFVQVRLFGRMQPLLENFLDNTEKCKEIIRLCYSILAIFCKNNEENQLFLFQNMHKLFMVEYKENLGQIDAFQAVLEGNINLCKRLTHSDLRFFVNIIHLNGRRPEYLQIFGTLNQMVNLSNAESLELKKKLLEILLDETKKETINPFIQRDFDISGSYSLDEEKLNEYKLKFIMIVAEAFENEVGLNLIYRAQKWFPIKELLTVLLELSNERKENSYVESTKLVKLLLIFLNKSDDCFNEFVEDYKFFPEILEIESQNMQFSEEALQYFKSGFIQLLVIYAQGVLDNTE